MNRLRRQKGYTIVELLVVTGILSILLVVLARIFMQTVELRLATEAESALTQDVRYMFSRLAYDISRADSIVVPADLGGSDSSLSLLIGADTYTYTLAGGDFVLTDATNSGQLNSVGTSLESITFVHLGSVDGKESVQINMNFESTTLRASGVTLRDMTTTIGLR